MSTVGVAVSKSSSNFAMTPNSYKTFSSRGIPFMVSPRGAKQTVELLYTLQVWVATFHGYLACALM